MVIPGIKIPWQVFACTGLVLILGISGWKLYDLGRDHKQAEWNASIARGKIIVEGLKNKQAIVTTRVVTQTVERVRNIKEKGDVIVRQVKVFVPDGSCQLPGGFRLLHDAAATNAIPNSAGAADAEPVPAQTAATTVAENYTTCNAAIADLSGLRQWVQTQYQVYLDQCKEAGVRCSKDSVSLP